MVRITKESQGLPPLVTSLLKTSGGYSWASGPICLASVLLLMISMGAVKGVAQCGSHLNVFIVGSEAERSKAFSRLFGDGVSAIPTLVKEVGNKHVLRASLAWPGSSTLDVHDSYCGVLAAYLVELALGMSSLAAPLDKNSFLGKEPVNYVYDQGRIVFSQGEKSIEVGDLEQLQKLYLHWWTANRSKTIQELRAEWKTGRRPLSKTELAWR